MALVIFGGELGELEADGPVDVLLALRLLGKRRRAHHHLREVGRGQFRGAASAGDPPLPQHRDFLGVGADLAQLVGDHQDAQLVGLCHAPEQSQDLVSLPWREDRCRLVEDQDATVEIKLLQNLELLLLTGRKSSDGSREIHRERHRLEERFHGLLLGSPLDHTGQLASRQEQVLGD